MKTAKVKVSGAEYYLVLDGEAMFQIRDMYGGTSAMLEIIEQDTREAFSATCSVAAIMAERGELVRRRLGYDAGPIPSAEDFALLVRPFEIVDLKSAVTRAISLGYGREVEPPGGDEYDEGLAELTQKKTKSGERIITG